MRYGFIGLGFLGKHLAANLARGGFEVTVFDLNRSAGDFVIDAGAGWAESVPKLAGAVDALITCLPSPAASNAVMELAFPAMSRGSTWIEMSTNDFAQIERLAARGEEYGVSTLACPVTGGVHRAESGDITVLVGGAQPLYETHEPALEAMGGRVIYLGGIEQAAVTKVVTNMLAFIHLIAAGEALMLCAKSVSPWIWRARTPDLRWNSGAALGCRCGSRASWNRPSSRAAPSMAAPRGPR